MTSSESNTQAIPFKSETQQVLDILIHSLYQDKEVFLRELISNASDALTRLEFEQLTNRDILSPDAELAIWLIPDEENKTLTIKDSGIGMNAADLEKNLGTIAHSGAKAFIQAAENENAPISNIIGQFGVGFYSVFMAADSIQVNSLSHNPKEKAALWKSEGKSSFSINESEKQSRGTEITINLKEDALEFTKSHTLETVIKKHSDFIPFPIYLVDKEEQKQINQQTAIWRQQPHSVKAEKYNEFYKQFSLDFEDPINHSHLVIDAPVQMYSLLFTPGNKERNVFSIRKHDGLKLYAKKILIQEYCQDLLPEFLRFVQGVVDSEDIPLNVSRETVQSSQLIRQLKKLVTNNYLDSLNKLAEDDQEKFNEFWRSYSYYIKEGVASDFEHFDSLLPLLRFSTMKKPEIFSSLDEYVESFKEGQNKIYFIVGEDHNSIQRSPHLELFKKYNYDVILFSEPIDSFMLLKINQYKEFALVNVTSEDLDLPELKDDNNESEEKENESNILATFTGFAKSILGEKVSEVRTTKRLVNSPARLVDKQGAAFSEMQRVYKLLDKEMETAQKILEINPEHLIIQSLDEMDDSNMLKSIMVEQLYENALLSEGIHPEPASMIEKIQQIMQAALNK